MGAVWREMIWRGRNSGFDRLSAIGKVRDQLCGPAGAAMVQPGGKEAVTPMLSHEVCNQGLV